MRRLFWNLYVYEGMTRKYAVRMPSFRMFVGSDEYNKFPFINLWVRRVSNG